MLLCPHKNNTFTIQISEQSLQYISLAPSSRRTLSKCISQRSWPLQLLLQQPGKQSQHLSTKAISRHAQLTYPPVRTLLLLLKLLLHLAQQSSERASILTLTLPLRSTSPPAPPRILLTAKVVVCPSLILEELDQYVEEIPLSRPLKRGLTLTLLQVRQITATATDYETTITTTVCSPTAAL